MEALAQPARRPSVVLAEDHPQIAREIVRLLTAEFDIVAAVTDGASLVTLASRLRPDVVVTDIGMPGLDGIEAASQLIRWLPGLPVVFVSVHDDPEIVRHALSIGRAFVMKAAAGDELVEAVHAALRGESFVSPASYGSTR